MEEKLKYRLVGALVLFSLMVIFSPLIISDPQGLIGGAPISMHRGIPEPPTKSFVETIKPNPSWITPLPHVEIKENQIAEQFVAKSVSIIADSVANHKLLHRVYTERATPPLQAPSGTSKKLYKLQIGIFKNEHQAKIMLDMLQQRQLEVHSETFKGTNNATWQRIWVGTYEALDRVKALQKQIDSELKIKSLIVRSFIEPKDGSKDERH